jgi:hypothetical protein
VAARKALETAKPHPRLKLPLIEGDWRRLEGLLHDGVEPSRAAASFGRTLSDFRRQDYFRHQRLLALSREARADRADRTLDEWANAEGASDTIRVYWHRYTANAAGRGIERHQLEVTGPSQHAEDRSASLDDIAQVLSASGALALAAGPSRGGDGGDGGEPSSGEVADAGGAVAAPSERVGEAGGVPLP